MFSPSDERYSLAPKDSRDAGNATTKAAINDLKGTRTRYRPPSNPPSHPAATAEVGQLLDLGLALGHQRFELVSLAGRDDVGMVAAHAWAEVRDSSGVDPRAMPVSRARSRRRPPPPPASDDDDVRFEAGHHQDALREVEWLRERVDNLSQELVLARRDSGRLAKQLKQEEGVGREQRRRADGAVREVKALREEVDRLKDARTVKDAASRAALSDAHSRSERMAERRRRQQAESLMQAYKGLYEDQLQTQHASAESYRSLTRGYSRLSADNKALRQQTTATAAGVASTSTFSPSSDGIGPFSRTATSRAPRHDGDIEAASDKHLEIGLFARSATSGAPRYDGDIEAAPSRAPTHGGELEAAPSRAPRYDGDIEAAPKRGHLESSIITDDVPPTNAVPLSDMVGYGDVRGRASAVAVPVPAEAVATTVAATAVVAAAAGALANVAESAEGASRPSHERPASAQLSEEISPPPPPSEKRRTSSTECEKRRTSSAECASTVETFACSPFSEAEHVVGRQGVGITAASRECPVAPPSSSSAFEIQERAGDGDAGGDNRGCTGLLDAYAFPTGGEPSARRRHNIRGDGNSGDFSATNDIRSRGGGDGNSGDDSTQSRGGDGHSGENFARSRGGDRNSRDFSSRNDIQSKDGDGNSGDFSTRSRYGDGDSGDFSTRSRGGDGNFRDFSARSRCGDGNFVDFSTRKVGLVAAAVAVPPVEPPPSWRGRSSAGLGRLLTSSTWSEAVDGPKRSSSPPPPRRGKWGEGGGSGGSGWGGGTAVSGQDGCTRIEPSRARPHSI